MAFCHAEPLCFLEGGVVFAIQRKPLCFLKEGVLMASLGPSLNECPTIMLAYSQLHIFSLVLGIVMWHTTACAYTCKHMKTQAHARAYTNRNTLTHTNICTRTPTHHSTNLNDDPAALGSQAPLSPVRVRVRVRVRLRVAFVTVA